MEAGNEMKWHRGRDPMVCLHTLTLERAREQELGLIELDRLSRRPPTHREGGSGQPAALFENSHQVLKALGDGDDPWIPDIEEP
jgi:hypothetical protein